MSSRIRVQRASQDETAASARGSQQGASLADSPALLAQRKQMAGAFGAAAQLMPEPEELQAKAAPEEELQAKAAPDEELQAMAKPDEELVAQGKPGPFARMAQAADDPGKLGLSPAEPVQEGAEGPAQLVKWEDHGAKKFNATWYFKDEGTARVALTELLGADAADLKDADWELGLRFATNREEGADSALKLLDGTARENQHRARVAGRRQQVAAAGLVAEIDGGGFSAIATQALKLGVSLFIEGNLNGSIGVGWTVVDVNAVIDELDGGGDYEAVGIQNPAPGDDRTGIVIRDVHKATDKAAQGKGSVYRPSDKQANINMRVLGKLVQVHLNVG
jgi:hypothetical protein